MCRQSQKLVCFSFYLAQNGHRPPLFHHLNLTVYHDKYLRNRRCNFVSGVPVGFFTSVYLAKIASPKVRGVIETAVSLLAGIPSVVYGLVGMLILVLCIRKLFNVPDGASLLAAIIVLAIMILPSIIKVSLNALEAVPKEYEDASLALGATDIETYFKVSVPGCKKWYRSSSCIRCGPCNWRGNGSYDGFWKCSKYAVIVPECSFF